VARATEGRRPRVIASLAVSADGKIDSVAREGGRFSSRLDRDRLDALRAEADALIVGAATVRAEDPPLRVRDPARRHRRLAEGRPEQLVVVVVTRSGRVPPAARFLREPAAARWLAVPDDLGAERLAPLRSVLAEGRLELVRCGHGGVEPALLLARLCERGCRTILIEGGGELLAAFLDRDLVDELRLTLCPTLLGGRAAPGLVGGEGWTLARRPRLRLVQFERVGDELFLRYEVEGPGAGCRS